MDLLPTRIASALLLALAIAGCGGTRPISYGGPGANYFYSGELSQLDIVRSLSIADPPPGERTPVTLAAGERVMLIQSGALTPDRPLLDALGAQYAVTPMSGVPSRSGMEGVPLRAAARAGGFGKVVVYWGGIETAVARNAGAAVSWVPIVGAFIPDQEQTMRVALTAVVADTGRGVWDQLSVTSRETRISTAMFSRHDDDQHQIVDLKADAYAKLAAALSARR